MFNQNPKFGLEEHYWRLLGFVKFGKFFFAHVFTARSKISKILLYERIS